MRRVQAAGNLNGRYTAGDPVTGVPRTRLESSDLNAVFDELVALVQGAGLTLDPNDSTQVLQAVQALVRGQSQWRNQLINGEFIIRQRTITGAASTNGVDAYSADRWRLNNNNGASGSIGLTPVYTPASGAPNADARSWAEITCSGSGLANPALFGQRIEDVRTFSGRSVTLSFWARTSAGSGVVLQPRLRQYHGPSPAPATVVTSPASCTLTGTWQRFTRTVTLPAVTAITNLGWPFPGLSEVLHWLELLFEVTWTGSSCTILVADMQLEGGDSASAFERRPWHEELRLCQRYYQTSLQPLTGLAAFIAAAPLYLGAVRSNQAGTVAQGIDTRFAVPMARIPTVTWYSPETGASGNIRWNGADRAVTSTEHTSIVNTGAPVIGSSQAASSIHAHFVAEAELQ